MSDDSFVRTDTPGVLVNTNRSALLAYKKQKRVYEENRELKNRMSKLEEEILQIKEMLSK